MYVQNFFIPECGSSSFGVTIYSQYDCRVIFWVWSLSWLYFSFVFWSPVFPDNLLPRILKELADEISPLLQLIYTKSLDTGEVPADWRTANVSPVYKKGLKSAAENYRPISLTSVCCTGGRWCRKGRVLVLVLSPRVHQSQHLLLSTKLHLALLFVVYLLTSFGSISTWISKRRSCETQLIEFVDDISKNLQEGRQTDILIMDFAKAFDKVNHSLLMICSRILQQTDVSEIGR
jgi:hypothetical protein